MKILVVEDDAEKLRRVTVCLLEVAGITRDMIQDARDANAAKRLLRTTRYEVLILDINIPAHTDETPDQRSGLDLLSEITERDIFETPAQIVGLTAYEDVFSAVKPRFEADLLQVVQYDASSTAWSDRLKRLVRRAVVQSEGSNGLHIPNAHVCVVAALASPELAALLDLPWHWTHYEVASDPTTYHHGWFMRGEQRKEVFAAAAPRMGMQASGVLATKMIHTFRPRYLAMIGILAGIRGECELGDVVVADPSWDYGSGKRSSKTGVAAFASAPHQIGLDPFLRGKLTRMSQDAALMDKIRREWAGERRNSLLSIKIGPVASGAAVVEDEAFVEEIRSQHRKTLGVEMETYGVFVAGQESPEPQPRVFSMKSVCDFADPEKNDAHQRYAAYTSASAFRFFCEDYL
ncbi:response regulator [Sphingomonas montanisoli]|uniref:Response regulator n=1 Tax=Sphingomonas montanisoli TaxID=2606412 RepID=A0A5D9C2A2_9SPHN|nr:response regulator [Sphingomonas montanisoli]TZG25968.1 response regulator [Sphingomonas montanisoli]